MQPRQLLLLVLALASALAVVQAYKKHIWGTPSERSAIIEEAISEAKLGAQLRQETVQALMSKPVTFQTMFNRGFKKPSVIARQQGNARIMMEDMVKRAERKLEEMRRKNMASTASDEEKAEMLASELYHRPGTLLTKEEIAKMFIESDCEDVRKLQVQCDRIPTVNIFRQIDGTCNNLEKPLLGASDTPLRRLTPPSYENGIDELRGLRQSRQGLDLNSPSIPGPFSPPHPSARLISSTIIRDRLEDEEPFSHLLMQFGQFLDHDLDFSPELEVECEGCELTEQCTPIRVRPDDLTFGINTANKADCLPFRRAIAVCDLEESGEILEPREQINALTSFIDGSMVYGSNERQGTAVRAFNNGLLKVGKRTTEGGLESLPIDNEEEEEVVACPGRPRDCFLCGDVRCNEQVSLTIMHTLWVREHNRIARELKRLNPFWSDELLYQEARKIVGAIIQKIVYYDYLPIVFGSEQFDEVIGPYSGYKNDVDPSVPNVFATAAYRYGHSLIRPQFNRLRASFFPAQAPLNLEDMFFNPPLYFQSDGVGQVARGWTSIPSRRVDEFMNIVLTTQLFQNNAMFGPIGMDLAALNMQRGRDHGLDTYNTWRFFCETEFPRLPPAEIEKRVTRKFLEDLHGTLSDAELFPAGLAETRVPGSLLGPTFLCLFGITFRDVRDGDRFYFENQGVFTDAQREAIKQTSFSRVICDNTDTVALQQNSFIAKGARVNCNNQRVIPALDLSPWQEKECFIRIQPPRRRLVSSFSFVDGVTRPFIHNNRESGVRECLPVACPGSGSVEVYAFSSRGCTTSGLGYFYSRFRESDLLTSIGACSSATTPTITFTCSANAVEDSDDTSDNPQSPDYKGEIPDELAKKLKDTYQNQLAASQAASNELPASTVNEINEPNDQHQSETVNNDKELLSELQEILDRLD